MELSSRIYIAGHTGLIGSSLHRMLNERGYRDLIVRGHRKLDLLDAEAVKNFLYHYSPQYVFLCAGVVGGIMANSNNPARFIYDNLVIQNNVISNAVTAGVKKLIFFGSSCMYPRICPQPMSEDYIFSGDVEPTSKAYAVAKMAGMVMCDSFNKQHGTQFVTVIPNTVYGPGDNFNPEEAHVLPSLIQKIHKAKSSGIDKVVLWGSGNPRREFIYVSDIADACIFLMNSTNLKHSVINVGSGNDISIFDLALMIKDVVGYSGEIFWDDTKPDGAPKKLLSNTRIANLGWSPKVDLRGGIEKTYSWYRNNIFYT